MARIAVLRRALGICFRARLTPFLWGHRGMGKSSLFRQLAAENGWGLVDLRCSQLEAADLRGLPDRTPDGRTRFLPPADLPSGDLDAAGFDRELGPAPADQDDPARRIDYLRRLRRLQPRRERGILLLDELNRAPGDVLQAAFQLVLDRAVGEYVLPPGWHVAAAGNFASGYQVNGSDDPAFLDRFCHLVLPTGAITAREWAAWMAAEHGSAASAVLDFAAADPGHLDGEARNLLGFPVTPSRRSWEAVVRACKAAGADAGATGTGGRSRRDPALFEVIAGLVGRDLATAFGSFQPAPVRAEDVLARGVAVLAGALAGLERHQLSGLTDGLARLAGPRLDEPAVVETALDFAAWLAAHGGDRGAESAGGGGGGGGGGCGDRDLALAFCRELATQDRALDAPVEVRAALVTNPRVAAALADRRTGPAGFLDRLARRPELQHLLADVAWDDAPGA